jgi:selenocysteine-specific elongation factor
MTLRSHAPSGEPQLAFPLTGGAVSPAERRHTLPEESEPTVHVVATAGHVDHGKSAVVRALTGMEPDRWAEERRRGMTIDLGFAWTALPDGDHLAFVDVPGHERLVGNMLAGVGPVPAVLLVVAADQGWQAQSDEHLAVLHALDVRHGLLAVSRTDLSDPAGAAAVRDDALTRIAGSSLGRVNCVAVSSVTGAGLDELRAALIRLTASLPAADPTDDVRLWIDRVFTVHGRGRVVTGTLAAGTLRVGDQLCRTDGGTMRVRGLQTLKRDRSEVRALARVAVNLTGTGTEGLRRGDAVLAPRRWLGTRVIDVRLRGCRACELPRQLTLHVGTAAVPVTVRPLGGDTARLSLASALPLRVNDRALLRDPGRHHVATGVSVLDVRPPVLTRRGAGAQRARDLARVSGVPDTASELRRRGLARRSDLAAMGIAPDGEPVFGEWLADRAHWARLRQRLVEVVEEYATLHPMAPGMPTEAARRVLCLSERGLVESLARSAAEPALQQRDGRLFGSRDRATLPPRVRTAVDAVRLDLSTAHFRAPEARRLAELGLQSRELAAAAASGDLLRIADGIVLLPGADTEAANILARLPQPFTTSQARQALDTTRRIVIPLLEYLDRRGLTSRLDDTGRRACRAGTGGPV